MMDQSMSALCQERVGSDWLLQAPSADPQPTLLAAHDFDEKETERFLCSHSTNIYLTNRQHDQAHKEGRRDRQIRTSFPRVLALSGYFREGLESLSIHVDLTLTLVHRVLGKYIPSNTHSYLHVTHNSLFTVTVPPCVSRSRRWKSPSTHATPAHSAARTASSARQSASGPASHATRLLPVVPTSSRT